MTRSRKFTYALSAFLFFVGLVALVDGYGEFAVGEESLLRWLLLPASQFILASVLLVKARKQIESNEAENA